MLLYMWVHSGLSRFEVLKLLHFCLHCLWVVSVMLDTILPSSTWCYSCGANGIEKGRDQLSWASHVLCLYFRLTAGPLVYCFTLWFMERCPLMALITKISSGRSAVENIVSQHRPQVWKRRESHVLSWQQFRMEHFVWPLPTCYSVILEWCTPKKKKFSFSYWVHLLQIPIWVQHFPKALLKLSFVADRFCGLGEL